VTFINDANRHQNTEMHAIDMTIFYCMITQTQITGRCMQDLYTEFTKMCLQLKVWDLYTITNGALLLAVFLRTNSRKCARTKSGSQH